MGVSTVIHDVSFLTYYGISCHLLQALWLIANLLPSLPRLPGYHLYMLINKLSQLPLTSEVATAPELRAAIYSTDICPESATPCSKAVTHWHHWATGTLRMVPNPSCKALLLAPFPRGWLAAVTAVPLTLTSSVMLQLHVVLGHCWPSLNPGHTLTCTAVSHSYPLPKVAWPYTSNIVHRDSLMCQTALKCWHEFQGSENKFKCSDMSSPSCQRLIYCCANLSLFSLFLRWVLSLKFLI